MAKKVALKYIRYGFGYLLGFFMPIITILLFYIPFTFLNVRLEYTWLSVIYGGLLVFISASLNSYLIGLSTQRNFVQVLILLSQYSLILMYLWVRATEFDSDAGMPNLSETLPVFALYLSACLLGAYVGARNPIQQFIQSKDRNLPKY
jgi:hypothetical protein